MATLALSVDLLRSFLDSLQYHHDDTPDAWNILGLRAAEPVPGSASLRTVAEPSGSYHDTLVVFGTREKNEPLCQCYRADIAPGLPSTLPAAPDAASRAHLLNGQYRYKTGLHEGSPALVPDSEVKIWRDADRELIREGKDAIQTGFFPFAIHAGGREEEPPSPDGCVLWGGPGGRAWQSLMELMAARPERPFWFSVVDAADLFGFAVYGAGNIAPEAPELPGPKRQALRETLLGIAILSTYQEQAVLGAESGARFPMLLNRLRHSGVLANIRPQARPPLPVVPERHAARTAMIGGFRRIYQHMIPAGLDHTFHCQLDPLRHFGPLGGL